MSASTSFSLLRPRAWSSLQRGLAGALAQEPGLSAARDVLLRPLELLQLMAADAPGALGDDVLGADRLRMIIHLASPFASMVSEAGDLRLEMTKAAASKDAILPGARDYEPGIIDHGALLIVALAAIRVAPPSLGRLFLETVHGLALSAAPAEAIGRLDTAQPNGSGLAVILNTLYLLDAVGAALKSPFLRPFAGDPAESARWLCLSHLLEHPVFATAIKESNRWDGATAVGIKAVSPVGAWPGDTVVVGGDLAYLGKGSKLSAGIRVVFAAAGKPPLASPRTAWQGAGDTRGLAVEVPPDAVPGWVGYSIDAAVMAANQYRAQIGSALLAAFSDEVCLKSTRIPIEQIPTIGLPDPDRPGQLLAVPARTAGNRFSGGQPRLTHAALAPAEVSPGGELTMSWESIGADEVLLDPGGEHLPVSGQRVFSAPGQDGPRKFVLTPVRNRDTGSSAGTPVDLVTVVRTPGRIGAIHVAQAGREVPLVLGAALDVEVVIEPPASRSTGHLILDRAGAAAVGSDPLRPVPGTTDNESGVLHFVIPAAAVHDGLTFTAVIAENDDSPPSDKQTKGPLVVGERRALTVVLVRPAIVEPPTAPMTVEAGTAAVERVAGALGIAVSVRDLPWADDSLAVLIAPIRTADDARVPSLLERLARRAMLTPGLEQAVWLMLLPDPPAQPGEGEPPDTGGPSLLRLASTASFVRGVVAAFVPAAAAHMVAVADRAGLPALLAGVLKAPVQDQAHAVPTARLRILGWVGDDVEIESVQEETRAAGTGAPMISNLTAVALDDAGHERIAQPVMCLGQMRPTLLAVLLPVSHEVTVVELRAGDKVLQRFARAADKPRVTDLALSDDGRLSWSYKHEGGARPSVTVALSAAGVTTTVLAVDPCDRAPVLPRSRFRGWDAVQLSVTDGWNLEQRPVSQPFENPNPVVIRRLPDGRFWADVPDAWTVRWTLNGRPIGKAERTLSLNPGDRGALRLEAIPPWDASPIVDARSVVVEA